MHELEKQIGMEKEVFAGRCSYLEKLCEELTVENEEWSVNGEKEVAQKQKKVEKLRKDLQKVGAQGHLLGSQRGRCSLTRAAPCALRKHHRCCSALHCASLSGHVLRCIERTLPLLTGMPVF